MHHGAPQSLSCVCLRSTLRRLNKHFYFYSLTVAPRLTVDRVLSNAQNFRDSDFTRFFKQMFNCCNRWWARIKNQISVSNSTEWSPPKNPTFIPNWVWMRRPQTRHTVRDNQLFAVIRRLRPDNQLFAERSLQPIFSRFSPGPRVIGCVWGAEDCPVSTELIIAFAGELWAHSAVTLR